MSTPEITRKQAWMKLAVLIADGLPDLHTLTIDDDAEHSGIWIRARTEPDFNAWAEALGLTVEKKVQHKGDWIFGAHTFKWHGWYVSLKAYTPVNPPAKEVAEELTEVRRLARIDPDASRPMDDTVDGEPDPDEAYRRAEFAGPLSEAEQRAIADIDRTCGDG